MALDDTIRNLIPVARGVVQPLMVTVTLKRWTAQSQHGAGVYDDATFQVVWEQKLKRVRNEEGQEVMSPAQVIFVEAVPAQGTAGRIEPVDYRDKIVHPDGKEWDVVQVTGVADPDAGARPYALEVALG